MTRAPGNGRNRDERREDALRPCRYLGYDRDSLARYLMQRCAFELAETQLRRAIWLNPFEPAFKHHLALCLYRQNKLQEARDWARKALEQKDEPNTRDLLDLIQHKLDEERGTHG